MKKKISLLLSLVMMLMLFLSVNIVVNAVDNTENSYIPETTAETNEDHDGLIEETSTTKPVYYSKPATPKVTSTNSIGGVQLNWNKVDGAVKYAVYRRGEGQKNYTQIGTTTGTTFLDKNVASGKYYCYTVRAFNSAGGYSTYVYANTSTRKYMATPKLTSIYNHQNGLAIKWNAIAGVTKGYRVYRRGAGQSTWTYLGTTKNLYFIDSQVKNKSGEYFRYTVIADGGYHSKFDTNGLYLKRLANPTLTSVVSSSSGVTVKWSSVKSSTGYRVYRRGAGESWKLLTTVKGTSYIDSAVVKNQYYRYTVRAVSGGYISSYDSNGLLIKFTANISNSTKLYNQQLKKMTICKNFPYGDVNSKGVFSALVEDFDADGKEEMVTFSITHNSSNQAYIVLDLYTIKGNSVVHTDKSKEIYASGVGNYQINSCGTFVNSRIRIQYDSWGYGGSNHGSSFMTYKVANNKLVLCEEYLLSEFYRYNSLTYKETVSGKTFSSAEHFYSAVNKAGYDTNKHNHVGYEGSDFNVNQTDYMTAQCFKGNHIFSLVDSVQMLKSGRYGFIHDNTNLSERIK